MSSGNIQRTYIRLHLFVCLRNKIDVLTSRASSLRPVVNDPQNLLEICISSSLRANPVQLLIFVKVKEDVEEPVT